MNLNLIWAIPATLAVALIWGVSAAANYYYGLSLGTPEPFTFLGATLSTSLVFGWASLAVDVIAALMAFAIVAAIRSRAWLPAFVCCMIFTAAMAWSGQSAIGYVALSNTESSDTRGQKADAWGDLRKEIDRLQAERDGISQTRPIGAIEANMNAERQNPLFKRSKGCENATKPESLAFCAFYAKLAAEIANAKRAEQIDTRLAQLRIEADTRPRVSAADPSAALLARLIGGGEEFIQTGRAVGFALIMWLIATFGLYAIWTHALPKKRGIEIQSPVQPAATVHNGRGGGTAGALVKITGAPLPEHGRQEANPLVTVGVSPKLDMRMGEDAREDVGEDTEEDAGEDAGTLPGRIPTLEQVRHFMSECTERTKRSLGKETPVAFLFSVFTEWCQREGLNPGKCSVFGRHLVSLGYKGRKAHGRICYRHVILLPGLEAAEQPT